MKWKLLRDYSGLPGWALHSMTRVFIRDTQRIVQGQKTFPFFPCRFYGWPNNQIDTRQINREKKTNLVSYYVQVSHKNLRLKDSQAIETYIPSWAKERDGVCPFKGEEDTVVEEEKSKYLVYMFALSCW